MSTIESTKWVEELRTPHLFSAAVERVLGTGKWLNKFTTFVARANPIKVSHRLRDGNARAASVYLQQVRMHLTIQLEAVNNGLALLEEWEKREQ